jgi:hypothetical protein
MLKDEPIEYIQEQFEEKNMVLDGACEQVSPYEFYEDIFGDIETVLPVVIIEDDETKHIQAMSISDALVLGQARNDVLIGGCTYFNNWISKKSAREIHSFIIDLDNAYSGTILYALQHDWKNATEKVLAKPTYIVNSGTGLHLYYVLSEPIPAYKSSIEKLDKIYRQLAIQQSERIYIERQVQWFGQDFRIAGGLNKYGWENTVFRYSDKWDIDKLAKAVGLDLHITRYGEKRTTKPKEKPKHTKYKKRTGWKCNEGFYTYSLEQCKDKTHEGNRYMSMCALSVIAYKCGIDEERLENDLKSLLPIYNKGAVRQIKEKEIQSAMKMYNERAAVAPRESLEHWQGWEYHPIKRNGRKRPVHLQRARAVQNIDYPNGEWRNKEGRPTKQAVIEQWQQSHPNGTKADCIRETGASKPTVYKYWKPTGQQ